MRPGAAGSSAVRAGDATPTAHPENREPRSDHRHRVDQRAAGQCRRPRRAGQGGMGSLRNAIADRHVAATGPNDFMHQFRCVRDRLAKALDRAAAHAAADKLDSVA